MQTDTRLQISNYATKPVTKAPAWHGLVAWDMLLNGMTTGLFLVAALSELVAPDRFAAVAQAAYPVALILLLVDLLCLVLDLGDPLRFHHMLRVFKPSSPMSFGTWSLTAFALPVAAIVALESLVVIGVAPADTAWMRWAREMAILAGVLPAFASA